MKYLLDSVILIDHLNGVPAATRFLSETGAQCAVSVVTRAEVLAGATEHNESDTVTLLDRFVALPINVEVADLAARLRRTHGWKLPDAMQAAVATLGGLALVTRDSKLYRGSAHFKVIRPYRLSASSKADRSR